ncbi:hypothetical protein [Streptomyces chiangmaiensis]|uniref:DUF3558 domain-containing protein n=1 Tax=Streptomyces chiangmaiensis TaxID=766497 RepID=A0ABU7FWM7_9ACTN|nr:hypothetical protein [Streptomyces chiangmaiensis]MED7828203.1 hypothetical protein [Streptomyces chiangmaiensis]
MKSKTYAMRGIPLLVAAMAIAGCSSDEPKREFTVPKALCGVSVPSDALSRLLPSSGKHLAVTEDGNLSDGSSLCNVSVDDKDMVLVISRERIEAGDSARSILLSRLSVSEQKSAENGAVVYADWAAASLIKCRGADVETEDISTLVKVLKPGRRDESAMKDLISGYTGALEKEQPCKQRS